MAIYKNYSELVRSNHFDNFLYNILVTPQSGMWMLIMTFYQSPLCTIIPLLNLYVRKHLTNFTFRMCIAWSTIVYSLMFGSFYWSFILILSESIRLFFLFGLLSLLKSLSNKIPDDDIGETALKRVVDVLKRVRHEDPRSLILELSTIYMQYSQGDTSDPFTQSDIERIKKFCRELNESVFIFESNATTIFFPTFVVRHDENGLHVTSEKAISLNLNLEDEICAICHEQIATYQARLECGHYYCLNCIYQWFDQAYNCPLCRRELS